MKTAKIGKIISAKYYPENKEIIFDYIIPGREYVYSGKLTNKIDNYHFLSEDCMVQTEKMLVGKDITVEGGIINYKELGEANGK